VTKCSPSSRADIDENPSAEKLGNFFKLVLEFERSIHESPYAAWRHVESENKTDPLERDWEEIARTQEEINLRLAGKRCPLPLPL
jgi:hemerythrin superfamily protein